MYKGCVSLFRLFDVPTNQDTCTYTLSTFDMNIHHYSNTYVCTYVHYNDNNMQLVLFNSLIDDSHMFIN